ncbi:hypothetical protein N0V88_003358 [Collariella sp. IMI 366227]|nr:hypothetical protein N0V88_003358 [Collariella sp. IMI 366227]
MTDRRDGILGLPAAVLGKICSQFCPHCCGEDCLGSALPGSFGGPEYFGTLDAMTKVGGRLGFAAQQVRCHVVASRGDLFPLLLRTLLAVPALGEHLRIVRLGDRDGDQALLWEEGDKQRVALLAPPGDARGEILTHFDQLPLVGQETRRFSKARLNAFLLFKMAPNITSLAILSEWPLAVFSLLPARIPGPKIVVKQATTKPTAPLATIKALRLENDTARPDGFGCCVDLGHCADLICRLPKLRSLTIRGAANSFSLEQMSACRPILAKLTTLDVISTSKRFLEGLIMCCSPDNLKHFRFTIDSNRQPATDTTGNEIVFLLADHGLHKKLESLHLDTANNMMFANDIFNQASPPQFKTVETLRNFRSLRHLSISNDNIYFPSLHARVLLRDPNTEDPNNGDPNIDLNIESGTRLVNFLPRSLETLKITGIYAILEYDVAKLVDACGKNGRLQRLRTVVLKGDSSGFYNRQIPDTFSYTESNRDEEGHRLEGALTDSDRDTNTYLREDMALSARLWEWGGVAEGAERVGPEINQNLIDEFREVGVEFRCDCPEFFIGKYVAEWTDRLRE